jgi:hypothetical protein
MLRCLLAAVGMLSFCAGAHTLPISYLRLLPDADYLHLELVFNPFELSFMSEVDENKDGELSVSELQAHEQMVADRVLGALKFSVAGRELRPETAGMDPDMSGHHVQLRAHFKVDARHAPLTLVSDLISIASSSHLTQVTCVNGNNTQMAQLDSQSREVTFMPPPEKKPAIPMTRARAVFGGFWLLLAVLSVLMVGAGVLLFVRRRIGS